MGKEENGSWSWTSALVGAATATAATTLLSLKPRDPSFHLISMKFNSFDLNFPLLDTELVLTVHVSNPNPVAIHYSSTKMSIFYAGSLLGSAPVEAGSQLAKSCKVLHLPARLSGMKLAHNAKQFLADVAKREMVLDARVDIEGAAKVLWWDHKFRVHVDSHVTVDPVFLEVIDQQNDSEMGDIVASHMSNDHIRAGEIVLFNVDGEEIPTVHRVTKVHEKKDTGEVDVLTRGDNNSVDDDEFLYAPGQSWLHRQDIMGRAVGLFPYLGWPVILVKEKPIITFIFGALWVAAVSLRDKQARQ